MILIDDVEILTVLDDMTWSGARDICTRQLAFSFLYNPLKEDLPKYKVNVGSQVKWVEDDKTLFWGYVEEVPYDTENDTISLTCYDFTTRLIRSKFIGRMTGTLNELAENICGLFNLKNGIKSDNSHKHNIVSDGNLSYYEVLKTACETIYGKDFTIYLDGITLKLGEKETQNTFEIGKNIRSSRFKQSIRDMVTKVLIIDNNGKVLQAVEDSENLKKYGLFQEVYNYNTDCKNNVAEAQKLLKGISSEGVIVTDNDNNCISGRYIKIYEPVNNFNGIFEIQTDNHSIGVDSSMELEVKYVTSG